MPEIQLNSTSVPPPTAGLFNGGYRSYAFRDCTDGVSNTFLLGEALPIWNTFNMYFATHAQTGSTNPPPNYQRIFTGCTKSRDTRVGTCYAHMGGFMSEHTGGLHMSLADGSVRFISENIDYLTWNYLGGKADGNVIGQF